MFQSRPIPSPLLLFIAVSVILFAQVSQAATWFVELENTSGTEDRASWATVYAIIQAAIDAAIADAGGEIWVAEGVFGEVRTSDQGMGGT